LVTAFSRRCAVDKPAGLPQNYSCASLMKSDAHPNATDAGRELEAEIRSLLASEQLHRTLFDSLPGMAYLGHTDRARTIEFASAGRQALLGLKPDQQRFQLAPLIHPDERDTVLEVVKSAVAAHQPFAIEYRLRHAHGDWRTVWEQGRPVRHGHQTVVQGHIVDVSHRLQTEQARLDTEQQLLQTQKFNALNQLAGGVAHEFNNLIAGILGSAELVAMDLPEGHPGHDTLKQIFDASNQAREFVHRLRALGQRPPLERKPIRLQPVIEECLQILHTIIPAKAELQTHIDPDCPRVNADHAQLQQAILDICLHAWQGLTERRGRIRITLENCPLAHPPAGAPNLLRAGPHVCLTVHDNSAGLEKSAREHLFHPFRTRRSSGKKTGLELFLVRETIQAHQGEIFVESEPGQGLTFKIYLPVAGGK
jgi:PAS domain S-box-containing protein